MHRVKTPVPVESLQAVGLLCDWKVPYHIYDHNYKEKIDWFTIRIMKLRKKIKKFHTSVNSSRDDKRTHEWIYILVHSFNASHRKTRPSKQLSINQKKKEERSERKKQSSLKITADLHHIKLKVRRREKLLCCEDMDTVMNRVKIYPLQSILHNTVWLTVWDTHTHSLSTPKTNNKTLGYTILDKTVKHIPTVHFHSTSHTPTGNI